jgi:hypothetical protein
MLDVKVGDEVVVFDANGPRRGRLGVVASVGRKYFTIGREQFRLDDGRINDGYGHRWVKTLSEAAEIARREAATKALRESGIDLRLGYRHTVEQLEALAEVVKTFTTSEED